MLDSYSDTCIAFAFVSLPTEPSPEGFPLREFMFVQGGLTFSNFAKHPLIYSDPHFTLGRLEFCLGG